MASIVNTMKECTKIDKPLVSILLAVYNPNKEWIIEQLISINSQNYSNIDLYVYDDCSEYPIDEEIIKKYINNFRYTLIKGEKNQGSNKSFEKLTQIADGDYFAYCDQDDIWEKDKISIMIKEFEKKDVNLVCCDLSIIDENGIKKYDSIREIRKRIIYKSGYNLTKNLFMVNFVTGCAMIVRRETALRSVPFLDEILHDQWIAIMASIKGQINYIDKPLVRYRQHNNNQTGILKGVIDKRTYYQKRIDEFISRYKSMKIRLSMYSDLGMYIDKLLVWLYARKGYANKVSIKNLRTMIKYRDFHKISIFIEIVLPFIPNCIFKYIIMLTKKGIL